MPNFVRYTLRSDLHKGQARDAVVLKVHGDGSADLTVFATPDESKNDASHGFEGHVGGGSFFRARAPRDPNEAKKGDEAKVLTPGTWRAAS